MKWRACYCVCALLFGIIAASGTLYATDYDRDGIADELEQALLEKFRPTFLVSAADCDSLPAEFLAGSEKPRIVAKNGTIYGQVFPRSARREGALVEIHYYHLWARDCGRTGHPLDTEHVAALVTGENTESVSKWKALYWYAAAHEDTLCDRSAAAKASAFGTDEGGIAVWVSQGKHASFLSLSACEGGCGQDRCGAAIALVPGTIVNIGELDASLNGAVWTRSSEWPLSQKMLTDFPDDLLAQLANSDGEVRVIGPRQHAQAVISAGGTSLDAFALGNHHGAAAILTAGASAGRALGSSARSVRRSFKRVRNIISTLPVE